MASDGRTAKSGWLWKSISWLTWKATEVPTLAAEPCKDIAIGRNRGVVQHKFVIMSKVGNDFVETGINNNAHQDPSIEAACRPHE